MRRLSASILSADFTKLGEEVRRVERAGADWIHIDVMDGHFVPNITMGPDVVRAVRRATSLPLDVHLMIQWPEQYLAAFAEAGADWLGVHVETCPHLHRTIQQIKELGVRATVTINPATPVQWLEPILTDVDMVLVMSVNPGFGGQAFIPSVIPKIETLRRWIDEKGLHVLLEVDGGVNVETIGTLVDAGVDVFVAGSAVFGGRGCEENVPMLKAMMRGEGA